VADSRYIRFVERQEEKRKPHPGLMVFFTVVWGVIAVTTFVGFLVFRIEKGGFDWSLLIYAIGGIIIAPIGIWRIKRDRRRQASWVNPVKS
jgi:uncharacterized membrane protein YfcA